jgi:hypothetical protein
MAEPSFLDDTRAAYDSVAADYAKRFQAELTGKPMDRALFSAFAELALAAGGGPVADIGCGPGHVTAGDGQPRGSGELDPGGMSSAATAAERFMRPLMVALSIVVPKAIGPGVFGWRFRWGSDLDRQRH